MSAGTSISLAALTCCAICLCYYLFITYQSTTYFSNIRFRTIVAVESAPAKLDPVTDSLPTIFVITPTASNRAEQKADLTRLSQTLQLVEKLHWIVVEDSEEKTERVTDVLNASGLSYTHMAAERNRRVNKDKGDLQRNVGLSYLHHKYGNGSNVNGVVYFADDDNSYDVRLFNNYIRHVKRVGVWAVALAGGQKVESPSVVDGRVVGWNVGFTGRKFATDMAGFAVNLHTILETNASFKGDCRVGYSETCFLEQLNVTWDQLEPFGFDTEPKRVLVWHTKTVNGGTKGDSLGFIV